MCFLYSPQHEMISCVYFSGHNKPITAMALSTDKESVFTGASDGQICEYQNILFSHLYKLLSSKKVFLCGWDFRQ